MATPFEPAVLVALAKLAATLWTERDISDQFATVKAMAVWDATNATDSKRLRARDALIALANQGNADAIQGILLAAIRRSKTGNSEHRGSTGLTEGEAYAGVVEALSRQGSQILEDGSQVALGLWPMAQTRTTEGWPDSSLECRACKRRTAHEVLFEEAVGGEADWISWSEQYRVVRCRGCQTLAFERTSSDSDSFDVEGGPEVRQDVYPRPRDREPMEDSLTFLDWHIDNIYKEALAAHNNNLSVLATMGIRALVEAICVQQGATKRNLEDKIDELVQSGTWPQSYHDVLDEMRFLGNDAAHRLSAVSVKEQVEALDAVEHVMRAVYLLPAQAARMQQRRAKRDAKKRK